MEPKGGEGQKAHSLNHCTKLGFLNCQSAKNKPNESLQFVIDNKVDICALAETWLYLALAEVVVLFF